VSASLLVADIGNVRVVKNQLSGAHIEFIIHRERRANADKRIASASRGGETQAVDRIDNQPPSRARGTEKLLLSSALSPCFVSARSLARDTKGLAELFSLGGSKNAARYYS